MTYKPNWERIRAHYKHNEKAIHQAGANDWGIDPYAWDSDAGIELTPIEESLWQDIRAIGAVMYPQFPVGRRFVDFGNPCAKVAIECDGRAFHQDAAADAQRQREIEHEGWTVYRISGRACKKDHITLIDDMGRQRLTLSEPYLFIQEIADRHCIRLWAPRKLAA